MIHPIAKVSEQVNRKCHLGNVTVQLSTLYTDSEASNCPSPKVSNSVPRRMHTLCSCDAHADHVILFIYLPQNFQCSKIGYLSNSWASCFILLVLYCPSWELLPSLSVITFFRDIFCLVSVAIKCRTLMICFSDIPLPPIDII